MTLLVVTPPAPLVAYELAKMHLRLDTDDEKDLVEAYIAAASAWIDGPSGWLGRAVQAQTLELRCGSFAEAASLPFGPATEIQSVGYVSPAGELVELEPEIYEFRDGGLRLSQGAAWPSIRGDAESVRVRFETGAAETPAAIRQAVLLLVGQWHGTREAVNIGNTVNEMPFAVEALLQPFRSYRD